MSLMRSPAVRTTTMMYTLARIHVGNWQAYNQITDGLFLGMIPIKEAKVFDTEFNDQHKKIIATVNAANKDRPLKLVVSVVEPDELEGKGFKNIKSMVSPQDWKEQSIEQHLLPIADQTALANNDDIINTILKMRKCILENGSVYVHCKAGRSRSAMMCLIYLVTYANMTFTQAKTFLIQRRKQVEFNTVQLNKALEIIQILKKRNILESSFGPHPIDPRILNNILDFDKEDPIPEKKSPNHLAGFFAGLISALVAPIAWFYGAYRFGKEIKQKYQSTGWGVVAGIAAFLIMPIAWLFGSVRLGQAAAAKAAHIQEEPPTPKVIPITPIKLPPVSSPGVKQSADIKRADPLGANISYNSPLASLVSHNDGSKGVLPPIGIKPKF